MSDVVHQAAEALRDAGARFAPGLTATELASAEARWDLRFCADHAEFLQLGMPVGEGWVDWRSAPEALVQARLDAPADGLLYDVEVNEFWPASWGRRPAEPAEALAFARGRVARWPRLVPLYGHRYLPPGPLPAPAPVLSVMQSDVIYYGADLLEWVQREFLGVPLPPPRDRPDLAAWSRLAEGCDDCDL
jgi:hypothetical protein